MSSIEVTTQAPTEVTVRHQTAETRLLDAGGVRFAYRRFGAPGVTPLVMLQHFPGNLDNCDPTLTDALARKREVILVDYPGAGSSSGEFGPTIADTARRMIAFVTALDVPSVDLLGFSITAGGGGFVAQEIALIRPTLLRCLILAPAGRGNRPRDRGHHGRRPRDPGGCAHAGRRAAVGDRRSGRHLATDPRR